MQTLTHGSLPSYQDFSEAFDKLCPSRIISIRGMQRLENGIFGIRGMRRLDAIYPGGNVDLEKDTLWTWLNQCADDWRSNHDLEDFAVEVLQILGFKWVYHE